MSRHFVQLTLILGLLSGAFEVVQSYHLNLIDTALSHGSTLPLSLLQKVDPARAKGEFFFFFFGGSGALGIGGVQIPKIVKSIEDVQALKGGPSLGGPALSINPVATWLYPEALSQADVEEVVKTVPPLPKIRKFTAKETYMTSLGYIERAAFFSAMEKYMSKGNKLAVCAVFDALTNGSGDYASPADVEEKLADWRANGLGGFKDSLTRAQAGKLSAYTTFVFLIAVVMDLIIESGVNGWL